MRVFVRHSVADYKAWRKVYDDFDAERSTMGVTGQAVFQSVDDPHDITVWHDFASADKAKSFAANPRLRDVMSNAGVQTAPQIWFTEVR